MKFDQFNASQTLLNCLNVINYTFILTVERGLGLRKCFCYEWPVKNLTLFFSISIVNILTHYVIKHKIKYNSFEH